MATQFTPLSSDNDDDNILLLLVGLEHPNETVISDAKCAEELQLQEAIMASLISRRTPHNISARDQKYSSTEVGESSQNSCEICAERKEDDEMFPFQGCSHKFCRDCISRHISIKIKKRSTILNRDITCPDLDCEGKVIADTCRKILPEDVRTMWDDAICESLIPDSQKLYCPYKDCSGLLMKDGDGEVITEAECPYCKRLFCAQCKVPWHCGFTCEELSRLCEDEKGSGDLEVHLLAKKNKWQRCPGCKSIVERNEGCLHVTCRCGTEFCYACGAAWSSSHGGCQ